MTLKLMRLECDGIDCDEVIDMRPDHKDEPLRDVLKRYGWTRLVLSGSHKKDEVFHYCLRCIEI